MNNVRNEDRYDSLLFLFIFLFSFLLSLFFFFLFLTPSPFSFLSLSLFFFFFFFSVASACQMFTGNNVDNGVAVYAKKKILCLFFMAPCAEIGNDNNYNNNYHNN